MSYLNNLHAKQRSQWGVQIHSSISTQVNRGAVEIEQGKGSRSVGDSEDCFTSRPLRSVQVAESEGSYSLGYQVEIPESLRPLLGGQTSMEVEVLANALTKKDCYGNTPVYYMAMNMNSTIYYEDSPRSHIHLFIYKCTSVKKWEDLLSFLQEEMPQNGRELLLESFVKAVLEPVVELGEDNEVIFRGIVLSKNAERLRLLLDFIKNKKVVPQGIRDRLVCLLIKSFTSPSKMERVLSGERENFDYNKKLKLLFNVIKNKELVSQYLRDFFFQELLKEGFLDYIVRNFELFGSFLDFIQDQEDFSDDFILLLLQDLTQINNRDRSLLDWVLGGMYSDRFGALFLDFLQKENVPENLRRGLIQAIAEALQERERDEKKLGHCIASRPQTFQSFLALIQDEKKVPLPLRKQLVQGLASAFTTIRGYGRHTPLHYIAGNPESCQLLIAALGDLFISSYLVEPLEKCLSMRDKERKKPFEDPSSPDWREHRRAFVSQVNQAILSGFLEHQEALEQVSSNSRISRDISRLIIEFTEKISISLPEENEE